ncbi:MAG: pirin family protein [Thermoleophilia bacterium]|nr:pirin family protein [Thermoleophilia bacterium]
MSRRVIDIIDAITTREGGGFPVRRPFPTQDLDQVDPFLLLDEMGPVDWPPGEAVGAPDHPHKGFETVTYLLAGRMVHRDSQGRSGRLGPGDAQWMTAGAGVVHSEMPDPEYTREGGRMHGFQLWVNLPRRDKGLVARYQDIPAGRIPRASSNDGLAQVRVLAGEAMGRRAAIETRTPILYLHYTIQPGGSVVQPVPVNFNLFAYVFRGEAALGEERAAERAREGQLVLFDAGGDTRLAVDRGAAGPTEVLLIGGVPLNEPVARYGPFVMNTEEEISQAFQEYRAGRMGAIA